VTKIHGKDYCTGTFTFVKMGTHQSAAKTIAKELKEAVKRSNRANGTKSQPAMSMLNT
jgi:hypothetical protein